MKKKILIIFLSIILLCGCNKNELSETEIKNNTEENIVKLENELEVLENKYNVLENQLNEEEEEINKIKQNYDILISDNENIKNNINNLVSKYNYLSNNKEIKDIKESINNIENNLINNKNDNINNKENESKVHTLYFVNEFDGIEYKNHIHTTGSGITYKQNNYYILNFSIENNKSLSEISTNHLYSNELPRPDLPEDKIFIGWYTEKNGKGEKFTIDTKISKDLVLYPYYEDGIIVNVESYNNEDNQFYSLYKKTYNKSTNIKNIKEDLKSYNNEYEITLYKDTKYSEKYEDKDILYEDTTIYIKRKCHYQGKIS